MNRNTRTLFVVGIAVLLAGIASWGVYRAISSLPVRTVPVAARDVVVAAANVPVGVLLTKEQLKVVGWPADSSVPGAFLNPDEVVGRGVTVALVENEPVTESKLAPKASGGGLPPLITPGMRAMSVRVNDVIGVAGFTQAGTRVDVVVTLRGTQGISKTVISNVQVLTAGRRFDPEQGRQGTAADQAVVTLLVTPEDAERLALATTEGSIVLALRNPLDTMQTDTKGIRMSSLLGGAPEPAPARPSTRRAEPPPPPPAPPRPKTIEAIRGAKVSQEIIKCCQ